MRCSQFFVPSLKETPSEAETVSHRLLLRAGFVRPLASGVYSMLPLGLRVKRKLEGIIREEMNAIGGLEFELPSLQPAELWRQSGRWSAMGTDMLRLRDRSGREMCLAMTHEELFTALARELRSYRELPMVWYQIATKFRDEPRPKGGLIRLREFTMKDSYSFSLDEAGLDAAFRAHEGAYARIFARCGLRVVAARADNGVMGGSDSLEFVALLDAGEDWVALSPSGVAENLDVARSVLPSVDDGGVDGGGLEDGAGLQEFATPGVHTIDDLVGFGVPAVQQLKTLVFVAQGEPVVVVLRGDHQLSLSKLANALGTSDVRPAEREEAFEVMGANFGSLGPVGVEARIVADAVLEGRRKMVSGANKDGVHVRGIAPGVDFACRFVDLRLVQDGELAHDGSGPLRVVRGLELGHIFKLGTRYAAAMGAVVSDDAGARRPVVMGSYGIGLERLLAAVAEAHNDERGLCWPRAVAPFDVMVLALGDTTAQAEVLYHALQRAGLDVLFDDRDERPGVKFMQAELIGVPTVLVVGSRNLERGVVEWRERGGAGVQEVAFGDAPALVAAHVFAAKGASLA